MARFIGFLSLCVFGLAYAGEPFDKLRAPSAVEGPAKPPVPLTPEQIKAEIAKETPEQQKLRVEIEKAGGQVCFNADRQIWLTALDGSPARSIAKGADGENLEYPHVSPDGKRVVYAGGRGEKDKFLIKKLDDRFPAAQRDPQGVVTWMANLDGSDARPLGHLWNPHWSPDGKRVCGNVCLKGRLLHMGIFDLEKGEEHIVTPPDWKKFGSGGFTVYTPDGKWLLSSNGNPIAVPLDAAGTGMAEGRKAVRYYQGPGGCNQEVSLDGKWVAWTID